MDFYEKLEAAVQKNDTLLCVGLDPTPKACPDHFMEPSAAIIGEHEDDPERICQALLAWNKAIIAATADLVCCYKPNIAFYEAQGQPGMELLRETIKAVPSEIPVLLDAKRGDVGSTAAAYAPACFEDLGADAVTLSPYLGKDSIAPFAAYEGKGLFVLCHTSNPSAGAFQRLTVRDDQSLNGDGPLYLRVAKEAVDWSPAVGLVVGSTYPEALAKVRAVAPEAWLLAPGIGAQGGDLESALAAGLRADGLGVLIAATRSITQATEPREAAAIMQKRIKAGRTQRRFQDRRATVATSLNSCKGGCEHKDLIIGLAELGALQFGDFTLASGKRSSMYVDLRLLVSRPDLMQTAAAAYAAKLAELPCDRIAGIPYAALPIGMAVGLASGVPLIYNRKESKSHGLGKDIEGLWQEGERVVIIEDVITTGGSIVGSVELFRAAGLVVEDAIVLLDRQQGGVENLRKAGIRVHSVLELEGVLDLLSETGHIPAEIRQSLGLSDSLTKTAS